MPFCFKYKAEFSEEPDLGYFHKKKNGRTHICKIEMIIKEDDEILDHMLLCKSNITFTYKHTSRQLTLVNFWSNLALHINI